MDSIQDVRNYFFPSWETGCLGMIFIWARFTFVLALGVIFWPLYIAKLLYISDDFEKYIQTDNDIDGFHLIAIVVFFTWLIVLGWLIGVAIMSGAPQ